jgi:hypothetical protein
MQGNLFIFPQCFDIKNLAIFSQKKGEQKYSNLHLEKINPNLFVRKKRIAYMIDKESFPYHNFHT